MRRAIYHCLLLAVAGFVFSWEAAPADAPKPTVAVYAQTASGGVNGQQLADALTQQLVASGNFVVIDRAHIQAVLQEQNIASQGQVTPTTVAQIGRMLGANYIIVVQIDSFTKASKARSDAVSLLLAQTYQTDVDLADHMEILEVRSGQILQSVSDSQQASSGAYTAQNRSTGDSFVTEAVPKVLAASAAALASKIDPTKMAASPTAPSQVVGKILSIDGDSIILSLAAKDGVSVGQIVDFYDVRLVHNPDTNATIRALVKRGSLQITEVDKDYSVAKPVQGHPRLSQVVKPE
jgi:hypothetical protein